MTFSTLCLAYDLLLRYHSQNYFTRLKWEYHLCSTHSYTRFSRQAKIPVLRPTEHSLPNFLLIYPDGAVAKTTSTICLEGSRLFGQSFAYILIKCEADMLWGSSAHFVQLYYSLLPRRSSSENDIHDPPKDLDFSVQTFAYILIKYQILHNMRLSCPLIQSCSSLLYVFSSCQTIE